jgi:spermidine synthase
LPAERPGNVIVFAFRDAAGPFRWSALTRAAAELEARYGLEFPKFVAALRKMNRYDDEHLYV